MRLFSLVVVIQISIILYLFLQIQKKRNDTLGVSINPVSTDMINTTPRGELKYFYEPKAGLVQEIHEDWLSTVPVYTFNKDTLNERFDYSVPKKQGVFRIITLGDSFTFGQNISTEYNWTELLEDKLNKEYSCPHINKFEVINLGVFGYDTAHMVERYNLRGRKYNPDLLIMLITDFRRMTDYRIRHRIEYTPDEIKKMNKLGIFYPGRSQDNSLSDDVRIAYQWRHFEKLFTLFSGSLLVIDHEKNQKGTDFFHQLTEKYPQIIYTQTPFSMGKKEYTLADGHLNREGHRAIANTVLTYLTEENMAHCGE